MTDCNGLHLSFSRVKGRKIQANFNGGTITSDAGALLLREVDKRIGLIDALANCIADKRSEAKITHELRTLLAQRIFAIAMGYEDGNDHDQLRTDPLLQLITERGIDDQRPLGSPATLCRLENSISRDDLVKLSTVFVEQFLASHDAPPDQIVLDFDATDDPVHGQQEGRFFHGYYDHYCFLPLYVFCGDQPLCAYLRPSKIDGAKHSRAIVKLLVDRIRRQWPQTKIIFRGDSGFCRWKTLRWCDRHDVGYIVGLPINERLKRFSRREILTARWLYRCSDEKQRIFADLEYAAGTWDIERRVIVKAEYSDQGANTRFVVTNLPGDPQALYDDIYCQRGEMENRIKEQQLCLFADRTSCHAFVANQFRLLLSTAAYVMLDSLRRIGLVGTPMSRSRCDTIRLKLLKIGARITQSVRRVVLHLATGYPLAHLFKTVLQRLRHTWPIPV